MELVNTLDDIRENMRTLDTYLENDGNPNHLYALALVKRGACFIAFKTERGYRFYPSRFMGYKANTRVQHEANKGKSGIETNHRLIPILHKGDPVSKPVLEMEYVKYCDSLGFQAWKKGSFGVSRKYWEVTHLL